MGAFPVVNPRDLLSRKKQLASKLMGRALGGRGGMGGSLFRQPGTQAYGGGHTNLTRNDSTNPWAVGGMGGAYSHPGAGESSSEPGMGVTDPGLFGVPGPAQTGAVGGNGPGVGASSPSAVPGAVGGMGGPPLADTGSPAVAPLGQPQGGNPNPNQNPGMTSGTPGQLIAIGDGTYFDPATGQIVGGGQSYGSTGQGFGTSGGHGYY